MLRRVGDGFTTILICVRRGAVFFYRALRRFGESIARDSLNHFCRPKTAHLIPQTGDRELFPVHLGETPIFGMLPKHLHVGRLKPR